MTGENDSPTLGTIVVACVVVAIIRLPMVVTTGVVAIGVGFVGDFDVSVRRAVGLVLLAWPLWAMIVVACERATFARRQETGTTRADIVRIQCLATGSSLLVSSTVLDAGSIDGLAYGLILAAIMCVVEILGLTRGRPFSTDWRAPTACSLQSKPAPGQSEFGA